MIYLDATNINNMAVMAVILQHRNITNNATKLYTGGSACENIKSEISRLASNADTCSGWPAEPLNLKQSLSLPLRLLPAPLYGTVKQRRPESQWVLLALARSQASYRNSATFAKT